jgi:hypothetical protein
MGQNAARAHELRAEVDRLPLATRRAMLEGIHTESIIVGADGNPRGGVCPIYATASPPSKKIGAPFARAWDRFAGARLSRPASERELRTLRTMLETSIGSETQVSTQSCAPAGGQAPPVVSLSAAIAAHKASQARNQVVSSVPETRPPARRTPNPAPRRDTGERDRTAELSQRHGWAWMRPFRRYDEYERALQMLEGMVPEAEAGPETESQRLVPSGVGRG